MYFFLPNKIDGLNSLMSKLNNATLNHAQTMLEKVDVDMTIPKFKFNTVIRMNGVLKEVSYLIKIIFVYHVN